MLSIAPSTDALYGLTAAARHECDARSDAVAVGIRPFEAESHEVAGVSRSVVKVGQGNVLRHDE